MRIKRLGGTVYISKYFIFENCIRSYFIQFTTKEPFWFPKKEKMFNNTSWVAGWLFVYFGVIVCYSSDKKLIKQGI